jgi:hypothetical protein
MSTLRPNPEYVSVPYECTVMTPDGTFKFQEGKHWFKLAADYETWIPIEESAVPDSVKIFD